MIPAFLAENIGRGAWTPERGEATRPGAKGDTGELTLPAGMGLRGVMGGEKQWADR